MKQVYCGGAFPFDCRDADFRHQAARDYRALLLGDAGQLLQRQKYVPLSETVRYIGPFYFETAGMQDVDIAACEMNMVRACTDAVFLLDDGNCPGTVSELTLAAMLGKRIAVFYIRRPDDEETESSLHSPCWYPILLSGLLNSQTRVFSCRDYDDAAKKIAAYVRGL